MDAMILSTVHRHRILKGAAGTSFQDVGSLREDRLRYSQLKENFANPTATCWGLRLSDARSSGHFPGYSLKLTIPFGPLGAIRHLKDSRRDLALFVGLVKVRNPILRIRDPTTHCEID